MQRVSTVQKNSSKSLINQTHSKRFTRLSNKAPPTVFSRSKQQRNNSNILGKREKGFVGIRRAFNRNKKKKLTTITARSILYPHPKISKIKSRPNSSKSFSTFSHRAINEQSNEIDSNNRDFTPTISPLKNQYQNVNATRNPSETLKSKSKAQLHGDHQSLTMSNEKSRPKSTTQGAKTAITKKNARAIFQETKHKRKLSITKRKPTKKHLPRNKNRIDTRPKRQKLKKVVSRKASLKGRRKTNDQQSPFSNPEIFRSIVPMHDENEITLENIHLNHLCCKPITNVKNLSLADQKKLIEHDYLTLISLLPLYLTDQDQFQNKIREKTDISLVAAQELERLLNDWGSTRLFIGANSPLKSLTQHG